MTTPASPSSSYRWKTPAVILLAGLVYLAGNWRVPLWDRDEAWYAQTSRQMLESGDWLIPRFLDQPRYAKPVFTYWCQAVSMKLLGVSEFSARLPNGLFMVGTLIVLAAALSRSAGGRVAHYTVLIFASSGMVLAAAKMCLTDSLMLFFLTIAQLGLAYLYVARAPRPCVSKVCLAWLALAMAVFTKGPIPVVILLVTVIVLAIFDGGRRFMSHLSWLRQTRPLLGIGIILAVVVPWLIAAYIHEPAFLLNMLQEPVRHLSSNQDGHFVFPGYHLATIWLWFFPWSVFLPFALRWGWRNRQEPAVRFAMATIIGNWVFAEVMITKLPHYLLPSFSSMAYLTARMIVGWGLPHHQSPRDGVVGQAPPYEAIGLAMLAAVAVLYLAVFPRIDALHLPTRLAAELQKQGAIMPGELIMTGYEEPSLAFYTDGITRIADKEYLKTTPPERWPAVIVLPRWLYDTLGEDRHARLRQIASLDGFNYNIPFGWTTILICRRTP